MHSNIDRRDFLVGAAAGAAAIVSGTSARPAHAGQRKLQKQAIRKATVFGMLPANLPLEDRFKLARDCGFDGVEAYTMPDQKDVDATRAAAEKTGLKVHSIMNQAHWKFPLSSAEREAVRMSIEGMKTSLDNAHDLGAETVR